ncbi:glycoside hydrolase family 108 protein [Asticcacaulis biprosthecium]|nr:glycosyl hydrolase 108 family protein [Asticcacaulis biprosthecium]
MARAKSKTVSPLAVPRFLASSRFAVVARHVLGIEGGHVNHKADPGGETNHGISLRFAIAEGRLDLNGDGLRDLDLDMDGDIDGADIRALTPDMALNLFYECFWRRLDLDRLPRPIDGAVFDQAVNGGLVAAVRMLQVALNRCDSVRTHLAEDGVLGRMTAAAAWIAQRSGEGPYLLAQYRREAETRYNEIVRRNSSQVLFLKGWVARARRLGDV